MANLRGPEGVRRLDHGSMLCSLLLLPPHHLTYIATATAAAVTTACIAVLPLPRSAVILSVSGGFLQLTQSLITHCSKVNWIECHSLA